MRNLINKINKTKAVLFNTLAYLPRKAYITILLLISSPALTLASGEDINSLADKWQGYFGTIKKFFWSVATLAGVCAFIYGMVCLVRINMTADYRGKMTNGKALTISAIGVLVAGGALIFGVLANSLGATDAVDNATSNDYSGFN